MRSRLAITFVAALYASGPGLSSADEIESSLESVADPAIEQAILEQHPDYTMETVEIMAQKARYLYGRFDLDDDGRKEVMVYLLGRYFCGTGGCTLLILQQSDSGWRLVNSFPTSRVPVVVRHARSNGWRDLVRLTAGGGADPAGHLLQFDGERYVEIGVVATEAPFEGSTVLAGEIGFDLGIPLEPRR